MEDRRSQTETSVTSRNSVPQTDRDEEEEEGRDPDRLKGQNRRPVKAAWNEASPRWRREGTFSQSMHAGRINVQSEQRFGQFGLPTHTVWHMWKWISCGETKGVNERCRSEDPGWGRMHRQVNRLWLTETFNKRLRCFSSVSSGYHSCLCVRADGEATSWQQRGRGALSFRQDGWSHHRSAQTFKTRGWEVEGDPQTWTRLLTQRRRPFNKNLS